jgi:hypothetical protein
MDIPMLEGEEVTIASNLYKEGFKIPKNGETIRFKIF